MLVFSLFGGIQHDELCAQGEESQCKTDLKIAKIWKAQCDREAMDAALAAIAAIGLPEVTYKEIDDKISAMYRAIELLETAVDSCRRCEREAGTRERDYTTECKALADIGRKCQLTADTSQTMIESLYREIIRLMNKKGNPLPCVGRHVLLPGEECELQ